MDFVADQGDDSGNEGQPPKLEEKKKDKVETCGEKFRGELHAFVFYSAQFAIDIFWGIIFALVTPFMKTQLKATEEFTSALWLGGPFAGLLVGTFVGNIILNLGSNGDISKMVNLRRVMIVSLGCILPLSGLFAFIPFMGINMEKYPNTAPVLALILFILLMVAINFYMPSFWRMKSNFAKRFMSKFGQPIWSALAYVAVVFIIKSVPKGISDRWRTPFIFGIAGGCMIVFTCIHLAAAFYGINVEEEEDKERNKAVISEPKPCCSPKKVFCESFFALSDLFREGGWIFGLIVFFNWASLYSLLPVATDWYAKDVLQQKPGTKGYDDAVIAGSEYLLWQQLAQLAGSIIFAILNGLAEATCLKKRVNTERYSAPDLQIIKKLEYHHAEPKRRNFYFQVITQIICLSLFSAGLFLVGHSGLSGDINFILPGFILVGFGPVVIYGAREFQRAFFRVVRFEKNGENLRLYETYEHRDSSYDVVFNNFLVLGQICTFSVQAFSGLKLSKIIFFGGGVGAAVSILLVISTTCLFSASRFEDKQSLLSAKPGRFQSNNLTKAGSRVVFRSQRKSHHS